MESVPATINVGYFYFPIPWRVVRHTTFCDQVCSLL